MRDELINVRFRRRAAGAVLVATAIVLTGCSSSGKGGSPGGSSSAGASSSASTPSSGSTSSSSTEFPGKAATLSPVKVGFIYPDGGAVVSEPEARASAEATVAYANDNLGGLAGHKIELDVCKEKEDPASALACSNQMVQDGVVAVLSPGTAQGAVIVPPITKANIAYMTPNATAAAEFTTKNAFQLTSGIPGEVSVAAKYAKQLGYKAMTIYVVDAGTLVATIRSTAAPYFAAAGVKVTTVGIPPGTPDVTAQVTAGLAGAPDASWIVADANTTIAVLKGLDAVGSKVQRWYLQGILRDSVLKAVNADNFVNSIALAGNVAGESSTDADAVLYRDIMAKYQPKSIISGVAPSAYVVVSAFLQSTQALTGEVTAASVLQAIETAKDVPLPLGHGLTFTCDGKAAPGLVSVCGHGALIQHIKNAKVVSNEVVQ